MFCKNCGKEIDDQAYVCPHCGVKTDIQQPARQDADSGSKAGWGVLSFFIPIVGLILFLIWREERPNTSKICGICALVSFVIGVVGGIIYGVVLGSALATYAGVLPMIL